MNMTYSELCELVRKTFSEYPGVQWLPKSSVVNDGFPGTFNLSLNEPNLLDEFGGYIDFGHNFIFGKIQPAMRPNDWLEIVLEAKDTKHLATFEMTGVSVIDTDRNRLERHTNALIDMLGQTLFKKLGLDPKKLYVKVCAGGSVEKLTGGRYSFAKDIPKDSLTHEAWKRQGVPEGNFIWDETRDTFLSLFMFTRPTPWGYRNELLYDIGKGIDETGLLDIGSMEYLPWSPVIEADGQKLRHYMIKDIVPAKFSAAVGGIGLERVLMAINHFESVMECDHIKPVYDKILANLGGDTKMAYVVTECVRAIHRVLADEPYGDLSRQRKETLLVLIEKLGAVMQDKKIDVTTVRDWLAANASANPNYPELMGYNRVARDIKRAFERREDMPLWSRAEFINGADGLEQVMQEMMEEKGVAMCGMVSASIAKMMPEMGARFRELRLQRGIDLKVITEPTSLTKKLSAGDKMEGREIRYSLRLAHGLSSAIYIWGNRIALLSVAEKGGGGMIIENKDLAEMMRRQFMDDWKVLEPDTHMTDQGNADSAKD